MKLALKTFFVVGIILLASCNTASESDNPSAVSTVNNEEVIAEENSASSEEITDDKALKGLKLNLGEKWKVNTETEVGMDRIKNQLTNFNGTDYETLGENVKIELDGIIDLCTMKGEDHDQYHIILKAMIKESKALKKGKSTSTDKLNRYMDAYYAHFEVE